MRRLTTHVMGSVFPCYARFHRRPRLPRGLNGRRAPEASTGCAGEASKKRTNYEDGGGVLHEANEELAGPEDDDDDPDVASDPEVDNYVLAQCERVRKDDRKWKVHLKEGIAQINGRDYPFITAACDFAW